MHDHLTLIFTAVLVFAFGLISKVSERWLITGPMVFMAVGLLVSPLGLDLFTLKVGGSTVKLIAEITLMLILFVDASLINMDVLKKSPARIPTRLLGVGLPLTMAFGIALGAILFSDMSLWAVALVALTLSPTDAALGQAVIKSPEVPDHIRQSVSVESGLNDGIALPPILFCMAALGADAGHHGGEGGWLKFMALQLTIGPLVGAAVGWVGGQLVEYFGSKGWMEATFQRLSSLSLALMSFALAEWAGGNGFIAAFCAGLALGARTPEIRHRIQEYGEAEGAQLSLFVFLVFGMVMIPATVDYWTWQVWVYAVASLTLIRMVSVGIAMLGSGQSATTVAFLGWFGPRGIASILYALIILSSLGFAGYEQMFAIISLTVMMSVIAHGISAVPLCHRYAGHVRTSASAER